MPLNQFTQQVNFLLSALSGAERIFDMMNEEPEVDEGSFTEFPVILFLVVKYLLNLLSSHHLLNESIDFTKLFLLSVKIFLTVLTVKFDKEEHYNKKYDNYHRKTYA